MGAFQVKLNRRGIPDEEILSDLRRVAGELAKNSITTAEYDDKGHFGVTTVLRRFKKWILALEKAGLAAPNRQYVPNEELFENIADVWTKLGQQPYGRHLDKAHGLSKFSLGAYEKRFGSWNKALIAFNAFIQNSETSPTAKPDNSGGVQSPEAAASAKVKLPEVQRDIPIGLRFKVLTRDDFKCVKCGHSPATTMGCKLHVDHILPWSKGGKTTFENLRTLCADCNIGRGNRYSQ